MDILDAFVLRGNSYEVAIRIEDAGPLFRAVDVAKIIDIQNIRTSIASFDDNKKTVRTTATPGGDQDTIFLTERGMYQLLMVSRKPVAKPFQEWVLDVLERIRQTGRYDLQAELDRVQHAADVRVREEVERQATEIAARYALSEARHLHDTLLAAFKGPSRYVVYFGKIRVEPDGRLLVKIGSTGNLQQRCAEHQTGYGSMTIFHVLDCSMHFQFERFLQHHERIKPLAFRDRIHESRSSNGEVFLVTSAQIETIKDIARRNLHRFTMPTAAPPDDDGRIDAIERRLATTEQQVACVKTSDVPASNADASVGGDDGVTREVIRNDRRFTNGRGHKVQTYSADGATLLRAFDGTTDAMRRHDGRASTSRPGIKAAIDGRTLYRDRRWAWLDRSLPDDTVQDIGPTRTPEHASPNKGPVAMLTLDRARVVAVFCDMSAAAQDRQFSGVAAISAAVKDGRRCGGHRFEMWDRLLPELRDAYAPPLPSPRPRANAQQVVALHPLSGEVQRSFASVSDVVKEMHIGRRSLQHALASPEPVVLRGAVFRYVRPR
jgi:prophage antirepressor-like protein